MVNPALLLRAQKAKPRSPAKDRAPGCPLSPSAQYSWGDRKTKTKDGHRSESLFLKVGIGGETVRVFGHPEELAERLETSGYDIPASEIQAGLKLNLPCLVVTSQSSSGYKVIQEFLPEAA